jgi:hypothetical protein
LVTAASPLVDGGVETMARLGEKGIGFRTPFHGAWLGAMETKRDKIEGKDFQETSTESVNCYGPN